MKVYLDNSATTAPREEVILKVSEDMKDLYGNPSSLHRMGLEAEKALKDSRKKIAELISASPKELYFTSGGTESNNIAIRGIVNRYIKRKPHIITTKIEHPSVLSIFEGYEQEGLVEVDYLDVDRKGLINLNQLESLIKENTILVSVMLVNNETGVIQPIKDISRTVKNKNKNTLIHSDAVQAFCKLDINVMDMGIDMLSISAHKIHAPKGSGAVYISDKVNLKPIITGGGQECGIRPGTENTFGIYAFSYAAELMHSYGKIERDKIREIKEYTIEKIADSIDGVEINSPLSECFLSDILNISIPGTRGEIILHTLEDKGIYVSTGSACSSKSKGNSHVLTALGLEEKLIEGSIRISFSYQINKEDIDYFVKELKEAVEELRSLLY